MHSQCNRRGLKMTQSWAELMQAGKRAVRKGECTSVVVAPDSSGADNYHNCSGSVNHVSDGGDHYCGCSYVWRESGEIVKRPQF